MGFRPRELSPPEASSEPGFVNAGLATLGAHSVVVGHGVEEDATGTIWTGGSPVFQCPALKMLRRTTQLCGGDGRGVRAGLQASGVQQGLHEVEPDFRAATKE